MSDLREMFTARLLPVAKAMLAAEARARGLSEGRLVDELVLTHCRTLEAVHILQEQGARHPIVAALHDVASTAGKPVTAHPVNYRNKRPK